MKITAIFCGQDHSMGYRAGQHYTLHVVLRPDLGRSAAAVHIHHDLYGFCPYDSLAAFLANWREVSKV